MSVDAVGESGFVLPGLSCDSFVAEQEALAAACARVLEKAEDEEDGLDVGL